MACGITATSVIPLWYGDEDGDYIIPVTIDTCPMSHGMGFSIAVSKDSYNTTIASIHVDTMEYRKVPFDETIDFPGYEGRYKGYVECDGTAGTIHVTLTEYPMTKLATPIPIIDTLQSDFADIKWTVIPILPACNADPADAMLYSVWFDGSKQADRGATHADFDGLTPGSTHTIEVQAVPRAGWGCGASEKASITFTTPMPLDGQLHIVTRPEEAMVDVNGVTVGGTDIIHNHPIPAGEYKDKVAVKLSLPHFKDKTFNKTLRPGLHEYALYRMVPADKIKGKTKKDRTAETATFTFTIFKRGTGGAQVYEADINLTLLNQLTGATRDLTTDASGTAVVTIPYIDDFFASGKQKLVCIMDDTADRIRTFRTITIRRSLSAREYSALDSKDQDWHEEDDANELEELENVMPNMIVHDTEGITRKIL